MKLAVFLSFKESMEIARRVGQDNRFIEYYLRPYSKEFEKVYVFSWINEAFDFHLDNVTLIPNKKNINPYLYNFLLPFINKSKLQECSVVRLMQFTSVIPALISKFIYKIPIISTYGFPYGYFLKTRGKYIRSIIWNLLEKITAKRVDKYIVTYKNSGDHLVEIGVKDNSIYILPNGVDTQIFKPKKNNNKKINLLFVGRFEPEKNIINLARALAILPKSFNYSVIFVGDGALKTDLEKELNKKPIDYKIIQSVPHPQLVKYYQKSDIFLLPSKAEGYPKVLVEAMSCGLACLVGRYDGYNKIIEDGINGVACDFEPQDICQKIEMIIKDAKLRESLSKNARSFILKNNNIKTIIEKEISVIKSIDEAS